MTHFFRSSKVRRVAAWLAGASLFVASPTLAMADDSDERGLQAEELFEQGLKLEATDPKAALAAFRASYGIQPHYRVLYNIGRACLRLGDKDCAALSLDQYLKDGGNGISPKRRKAVQQALKMLPSKASTAQSTTDAVAVKADTSATPTTEEPPPPPPPAEPVAPPDAAAEPPPVARSEAKPAAKSGVPVLPWIIAGTTGAATVVTGILTANASSDYQALQRQYPVDRKSLDDAHGKGRDLLLVTGVLGAATVVFVGVGTYFTFFRGNSPPPRERTVGVAVGPSGVSITGRLP
jgi:hypothetical protein